MIVFLVSVCVALFVSAICSLMEATLLSLTPSQVADMSQKHPKMGAVWHGFKKNIERPISVILVLNTAAHTIGASVAGAQFDELFGQEWIWLFSLLFTFAMLQFTEILPKTFGVRYNMQTSLVITRPLQVLIVIFNPLLKLIHWINRPFEGRRKDGQAYATLEEISALAGLARLSNQIGSHQERIIKGASRLSRMPVEQLMIPVDQVAFLSTSQSLTQAILAAHIDSHTRFPVIEADDRDHVLGYVNFKEMIYFMRTNPKNPSLSGIIRPVHFVSPETSASDLLRVFVDQHVHMAIVKEEGQTLGLVTFEDLVEELVGEIEDEFDRLPRLLHPLSGGIWMIGGGVAVAEVQKCLGIELPTAQGTVAAWLGSQCQDLPKAGQILKVGDAEFLVRRVRRGKIFEAAVRKLSDDTESSTFTIPEIHGPQH